MFPGSYFPKSYFNGTYWPPLGGVPVPDPSRTVILRSRPIAVELEARPSAIILKSRPITLTLTDEAR